jgi:hypothetical protein
LICCFGGPDLHVFVDVLPKKPQFRPIAVKGKIIVKRRQAFDVYAMPPKVEVLTDRIGKRRKTPDPVRAVRHFDAARTKLDKLQVWRRELKIQLTQCIEERDAARAEVDQLRADSESRVVQFNQLMDRLGAQEGVIAELCDERDQLRARNTPTATSEPPALTVRVLEKVATHVIPVKPDIAQSAPSSVQRPASNWVKRLFPNI